MACYLVKHRDNLNLLLRTYNRVLLQKLIVIQLVKKFAPPPL